MVQAVLRAPAPAPACRHQLNGALTWCQSRLSLRERTIFRGAKDDFGLRPTQATMALSRCRVCDRSELALILDLGRTALANRFLTPELAAEHEPIYPLRLMRCDGCGLVQIDETVPPEDLF